MTVKNEAEQLIKCLDETIDLFSEVEIIDIGSTDDTVALLAQRYGVQASQGELDEKRGYSLCDLRNQGFDNLQTPWILCLDADERIDREELQGFLKHDGDAEGYFTPWHTFSGDIQIEDYKLSLFKRGYQKLGLVHDNMQASFRQHKATADWYPDLTIKHYPPINRSMSKHQYYERRLHYAIDKQKHWVRYHWFLGYRQFKQDDHRFAAQNLQSCLESESLFFPVEVLNSAMVLLEIYSLIGDFKECLKILRKGMTFYRAVQHDFEVKINNHREWFDQCKANLDQRKMVIAPTFAY